MTPLVLLVLACVPRTCPDGQVKVGGACVDATDSVPTVDDTATTDSTGDDSTPTEVDGDGDGWLVSQGDCDDTDATRNPGAAERCNDVDDDCDEATDEDAVDATVWYQDLDEDGAGVDATGVAACDQPAYTSSVGGDCDDDEPAAYPGADELCDQVDNDCNGTVDDGATGTETLWEDADGDGYGQRGTETTTCPGAGYADNDDDCNDTNPDINPGADEICNRVDDDCDGGNDVDPVDGTPYYADADVDGYGSDTDTVLACGPTLGYVTVGGDCDDADADVNPAATEVCNLADDDCDGVVNDGATDATTVWVDADGDGYGERGTTTTGCPVLGYADNDDDCDDGDAAVNPAGIEVCDRVDQDCDGTTDELAVDMGTWYADGDGDGYGDDATATVSCNRPRGYVDAGGDCDDGDAAFNPGAAESCGSLIDYNCDGVTGVTEEGTYFQDADGDGYGNPYEALTQCGRPTGYVDAGTDCDDGDATVNPGEAESCNYVDDDCDGDVDEDLSACHDTGAAAIFEAGEILTTSGARFSSGSFGYVAARRGDLPAITDLCTSQGTLSDTGRRVTACSGCDWAFELEVAAGTAAGDWCDALGLSGGEFDGFTAEWAFADSYDWTTVYGTYTLEQVVLYYSADYGWYPFAYNGGPYGFTYNTGDARDVSFFRYVGYQLYYAYP